MVLQPSGAARERRARLGGGRRSARAGAGAIRSRLLDAADAGGGDARGPGARCGARGRGAIADARAGPRATARAVTRAGSTRDDRAGADLRRLGARLARPRARAIAAHTERAESGGALRVRRAGRATRGGFAEELGGAHVAVPTVPPDTMTRPSAKSLIIPPTR